MNPAQLVLLRHMRRDGASIRKCAAAFGVSKGAIHRIVLRMDAPLPRLPLTQLARMVKPYGFIYVFAAQSLVKVGFTQFSPYRRWHSIKTANPWLEDPLYVSHALMGRVREIEKACHVALREYHYSGEWFQCDRDLAITTVQGICNG